MSELPNLTLICFHFSSLCNEPFESAETNLKRAIAMYRQTKASDSMIQSCFVKLFRLLQLWDDEITNYEQINLESQVLKTINQVFN